jgi:hypothetical protein
MQNSGYGNLWKQYEKSECRNVKFRCLSAKTLA